MDESTEPKPHEHDWQPPSGYRPQDTRLRVCICGDSGYVVDPA